MSELKLAVYGYGTNAGKAFFEALNDSDINCTDVCPLAYGAGEYDAVNIMDRNFGIVSPDVYDFESANVFISFSDDNDSRKLVKEAQEAGCLVIDAGCEDPKPENIFLDGSTTSLDQMLADRYVVPMNSAATMLALLLKPLDSHFGLEHAEVTLMESVSGLGADGAGELARETIALLNMRPVEPRLFANQMAFNIHTALGDEDDLGITTHEHEVQKQLELALGSKAASRIMLNCVLVPVYYGHTAVISFTAKQDLTLAEVKELLADCVFIENADGEEITPASHGTNEDNIFISRVHGASGLNRTYSFMAVMDNARRGLAMNVLAIVKKYAEEY